MGEGVRAFSSTREGGVSTGAYAGFNITHYCGDEVGAVAMNRKTLCTELGIGDDRLILPRQTHGCEVLCVDEHFLSLPSAEQTEILHAKDAVVTDVPRLCIGVSTADCVPLLLYDAVKGVVAAVHAGWRGTVACIAKKAFETMRGRYNSLAADVKVVIAPSISLAAFEVGDEVYDAFATALLPVDKIARRIENKWHIDLWEANRLQLLDCGVCADAIEVCGVCTFNSCDEFFSARRLGINSGRIFNGIMLV